MDSKKAILQLNELKKRGKGLRLAAEWDNPWQSLISTILSARTRDDKTIAVSKILYKKYRNLQELSNARLTDVKKIIRPINFYKTKAKNIINCAKEIVKKYDGKIPREFEKLIELAGVGRKTANVFLAHQGGANIGVDTHVGHISHYLGWTRHTKPRLIEEDLKKLFPRSRWRSINYILVRFGQSYKSRKKKNEILDEIKTV
ncbi:MAG: endonuclease III [Candidatus Pacearchaeota archaeon]